LHNFIVAKEEVLRKLAEKRELHKYELMNEKKTVCELSKPSAKKRAEKIEKKIAELQAQFDDLNRVLANPDVLAQMYVDTLPASKASINLDRIDSDGYKMTQIPDLSRFFKLNTLYISFQENLVDGFDRLPTTLMRLVMFKAKSNTSAEWLSRLVNLRYLDLGRNDLLRSLPDLSRLRNLETLYAMNMRGLTELPSLPTNIKIIMISLIPDKYLTHQEWTAQTWKRRHNQDTTIMLDGESVKSFIHKINRVNRFDAIRDELLATTARIVLNPGRIARILAEHGGWIGDCDAIMDAFELQPRQKYYHC
jgi:hypothetical protein